MKVKLIKTESCGSYIIYIGQNGRNFEYSIKGYKRYYLKGKYDYKYASDGGFWNSETLKTVYWSYLVEGIQGKFC